MPYTKADIGKSMPYAKPTHDTDVLPFSCSGRWEPCPVCGTPNPLKPRRGSGKVTSVVVVNRLKTTFMNVSECPRCQGEGEVYVEGRS